MSDDDGDVAVPVTDDPAAATRENCCNVFIVSNGARISLEQPAANALAMLFLIPVTHGACCACRCRCDCRCRCREVL